ncbi:amidohydrolase family protein [Pontibacter sp. G13]|uniref:amidohydrolase n=1 Tax=Pontibacter sp. G13 TaxID=3074898 RepID=UPI00288B3762|nr:amidohydrolase family protein [Pontibacter sp. G13]WNJ17794.1 amidohydrolase family protein [Pontibacter sp. G13]
MRISASLTSILSLLLLVCCGPKDSDQADAQAESYKLVQTVYHGGDILTMDGETPNYVEAVVQREGRIIFVGSKKDALDRFKDKAEIVDLKGKTLLPGFIDAHSHFSVAVQMVNQQNLSVPPVGPVTDIASLQQALVEFQQERQIPPGEWVVGYGYDNEGLAEGRHITKMDLDEVLPDHKVLVIHVSQHGGVLNSKGLEWAGVTAETETPKGGIIARMPGSQEPAGLLMETAWIPIFAKVPTPSDDELLKLLDAAQQMYASQGYTHAQDGAAFITQMRFMERAVDSGLLYLDLVSLPNVVDMPKWIDSGEFTFGEYIGHLKFQGVKLLQDGSPQGKTAYVSKPYLTGGPDGQKNWRGETTFPTDEFNGYIQRVLDKGLQVFVHANGDATIDEVIAAIKKAGITAEDDRRPVVIHSQFQRPDHLDQYVELGLQPAYFTNHTYFWGDVHIKNIGRDAADFISPVMAAKAKGLVYSNHSDFNVTPLDPFFIMWTARNRITRNGIILGEDQRADPYTALQGITTGAAYQVFEENRKGKIKEGMLADFVILDKNPLKTEGQALKEIKVVQTIKEGQVVYPQ